MNKEQLRRIIYGQLKNTFNSHPEYLSNSIDVNDVCNSATKRIFGELKKLTKDNGVKSLIKK